MAQYAIDFYGKELYGAPLYVAFDAGDMVAEQTGYSRLEISWDTPMQTRDSKTLAGVKDWSRLRLVRSPYGIPDTENDGWVLLDVAAGEGDGTGEPENRFIDYSVVDGKPYYYAVFVASELDDYASWRTYQAGDLVTSGGISYRCLKDDTKGVTPAGNPTIWETTDVTTPWVRAGYCVGLVVKDHGYTPLMYDLIPRPYKVAEVETTASSIPVNDELMHFMEIFGFHFNVMKSENDRLLYVNDLSKCSDRQLGLIAYQQGLIDQLPSLAELRRLYMRDALMIQRDRGTPAAAEALVESMTGWGADVTDGYNMLHDQDMAAWQSPTFPAWNPDTVYNTHVSPTQNAPIVEYGGLLYRSIGGSVDYSAGALDPTWVAVVGPGTMAEEFEPLAYPYHEILVREAATTADGLEITFPAPQGAGTYQCFVTLLGDPDGAIVSAKITGSSGSWQQGAIDLYREGRQRLSPVRLGPGIALGATGNKLTIMYTGVNPLSTGKKILFNFFNLQKVGAPLNQDQLPTTATSFWQAVSAGQVRDFDSEWNPATDGYGNWNVAWGAPGSDESPNTLYNRRFFGSDQYMWVSVKGPDTGTWPAGVKPAYPGNSLAATVTGDALNPSQLMLTGAGSIKAPTWDANTRYFTGQYVSYNPRSLPDAPVYRALTSSEGAQPDTSTGQWEITSRPKPSTNQSKPDAAQVQTQCIALPAQAAWSPQRTYTKGDVVTWMGHLYQAALPQVSQSLPSGDSTDNKMWRWMGLDVQKYTFTVHHHRSAGTTQVHPQIVWYDAWGNALNESSPTRVYDPRQQLLDRFEYDGAIYPPSTTATAPPLPAAWQMGVPIPWIRARGNFTTKNGLVYPTSWGATTDLEQRAGRVLRFNRAWVYTSPTTTDESAYVTFISPPQAMEGKVMEHGMCLRYGGTSTLSNYFLASRDRLTYTTMTFDSGGAVTNVTTEVLATWTPFDYGTRMRCMVGTDRIRVGIRKQGTFGSWQSLADVTDSRNNTRLAFGILERVREP